MGGFLSSLLSVGTQAGGDYAQAQRAAAQMKLQQTIESLMMGRQFQTQDIENAYKQAQTKEALHNAARLQLGDNGYQDAMAGVAGAEESARVPGKVAAAVQTEQGVAPIKTQQAVAQAQALEPINVREAGEKAQATLPSQIQIAATRAGFTPRAQNAQAALPQLQSSAATLAKYNEPGTAGALFSRSALGKYTMTPEGQIADQAADQFATSYLLAHAIRTPSVEQKQEIKRQILVQPGEEGNPVVVANKKARLQQMVEEINGLTAQGVGQGIGEVTHSVVSKYGITPTGGQ